MLQRYIESLASPFSFFGSIWPLFLFVLLGFFAARRLEVALQPVARLVIYILTPIVVFSAVLRPELRSESLFLPLVFLVACSIAALSAYAVVRIFFPSPSRNILAFAIGDGNSGFYGIPVGMAILGTEAFPMIALSALGFVLYENTLGFFLIARGNFSLKESLRKVARLPAVYAFGLGLTIRSLAMYPSQPITELFISVRHAYSVLGMMLIGLALGQMSRFEFDLKFVGAALFGKLVVWPLAGLAIIPGLITTSVIDLQTGRLLLFMSTVPLAANTVAFATELNAEPGKASMAVLASTVIAPFVTAWLLPALAA